MLISSVTVLYMLINDHVDSPGVNFVTDRSYKREPIRAGAEVTSDADSDAVVGERRLGWNCATVVSVADRRQKTVVDL